MGSRRQSPALPPRPRRVPAYRAEHFPGFKPHAWLDQENAELEIESRLREGELTADEAAFCQRWVADGYVIIPGLFDHALLDRVWAAYEKAIHDNRIRLAPDPAGPDDPFPGRFLNPHKRVGEFCALVKHRGLLQWLTLLLEREPRPLQTIASHKGSQQPAHSDSIHMTTYPLGYLSAAWIAFEDIHPDSGPLVYYPGSHRLPYVFSHDVGISESDYKREGYGSYQERYEPFIRAQMEKHGFEARHFHARKGDALLWHANLVHGGSPRIDLSRSRKAVVCHFTAKDVLVYHDLASKRSRQHFTGTCMLRDDAGRLRFGLDRGE